MCWAPRSSTSSSAGASAEARLVAGRLSTGLSRAEQQATAESTNVEPKQWPWHCAERDATGGGERGREPVPQWPPAVSEPSTTRRWGRAWHGMVPQRITEGPRPGASPPQVLEVSGRARRKRLRSAIYMVSGARTWASSEGMAVSQSPAWDVIILPAWMLLVLRTLVAQTLFSPEQFSLASDAQFPMCRFPMCNF